jgi:hypothetical protein
MKKFDASDLKPCPHMRGLVSAKVDGNLHGIAAWYTDLHISGCNQCQASIPFLTSLKDRLSELEAEGDKTLADDRKARVEAELIKIDSGVAANI